MTTFRKPRPLLRRYGPDVVVLLCTAAFLAGVSTVGLWLMHSG